MPIRCNADCGLPVRSRDETDESRAVAHTELTPRTTAGRHSGSSC